MNHTTSTGDRKSFFQLFSHYQFRVVIPLIQRDYAQGRVSDTANEVRTDFLHALYSYLDEGRPYRDLDFIYGTIQGDETPGIECFIPLDGQQRLTTLFLLHWYLSQICGDDGLRQRFRAALMEENPPQSRFTYQTRQSSTEFCNRLMQHKLDIPVPSPGGNELSTLIRNQPWFFRRWQYDPTISAMLVMLDAISKKFYGRPEFFALLLDENRPIVTFMFMNLQTYKLTDDLYIKMNSRGKPLTHFENFKAKFEQYLKNIPDAPGYRLTLGDGTRQVGMHHYFAYKIDTDWTDTLWRYCIGEKGDKQVLLDSYLENIIRTVITTSYARSAEWTLGHNPDAALSILLGKDKSLSFGKYETAKALSPQAAEEIIDVFDSLNGPGGKPPCFISEEYRFYYDEDAIFRKALKNALTLPEKVQFYAYISHLTYCRKNGIPAEESGMDQWMRVICNLTHPDNTATDKSKEFATRLKAVDVLLPHATDIIGHLRESDTIRGFSQHQADEECIKAHLVCHETWRKLVEESEKHDYFNGQIGFLLEFSGICDHYDSTTHAIRWRKCEEDDAKKAFAKYSRLARHIFMLDQNGERCNDSHYCFERAVLAHGDYLMQKRDSSYWNLLSTETVANNVKRDLSWKRLLRLRSNSSGKSFVKRTFDDIGESADITAALEALCHSPDTGEKWRDVLIAHPEHFELCKKGFIFRDEGCIMLMEYWYLNHFHHELFARELFLNGDLPEIPGIRTTCAPQKCADIIPFIEFSGFMGGAIDILVTTVLENRDFGGYELSIWLTDVNKQECEGILLDSGFQRDGDKLVHLCDSRDDVVGFLQDFAGKFPARMG